MDFKNYLVGKTLISLPHSKDKNFHRTVVYICGHDEHGAIGLIVNKLVPSLSIGDLFSQLNIPVTNKTPSKKLLYIMAEVSKWVEDLCCIQLITNILKALL